MTSSPCLHCERRDLPKEECLSECAIIRLIQDYQFAVEGIEGVCAIDYGDEERYIVNYDAAMAE